MAAGLAPGADCVGAPSPEPQSPPHGPVAVDAAVAEPKRGPRGGRRPKRSQRDEPSGDEEPVAPRRSRTPAEGREGAAAGVGAAPGASEGKPAAAGAVPAPAVVSAAASNALGPASQDGEEPGDAAPQRRPKSNGSASSVGRAPGQRGDAGAPKPDLGDYRLSLAHALRQAAMAERREARERLWRDARRLGRFRRGLVGSASDRDAAVQWEGGTEAEQIEALRARIAEQKQQVERSRKSLNKPRTTSVQQLPADGGSQPRQEEIDEEIWEQRELCNTKLAATHRDEQELKEREQRLHAERVEYLRHFRTIKAEDQVDFGSFLMLQQRYQPLRLLSRNGNTSVYRAHDLSSLQPVWLRIHQLDSQMIEHEASLARLAQECEALKLLRHPVLAALLDHFPHENGSSFVTVWENCEGETLDQYLLRNGPIPEKEARGVALQLLSALRFAEYRGLRVDCQCLKPTRLTFRGGEVKVAGSALLSLGVDCGANSGTVLAVSEAPQDSCGLETQPEEPLIVAGDPSNAAMRMIGMTLHQALFGKWPEAQGEEALGNELSTVQLPDQPKLSAECRECLGRLLDRDRRLTVQEAYNDPFIAPARKPRSSTG